MVHEIRTYAYVYTLGSVRLGFVVGRHPKKVLGITLLSVLFVLKWRQSNTKVADLI